MKKTPLLAVLALVAFLSPSAALAKGVAGTWHPIAVEMNGGPIALEPFGKMRLTLTETTYSLLVTEGTDKGTIKLDPKAKPAAIDVVGTEGVNKGKTFLGIYKLEGGKLTICYDLSGKGRPTKFAT